MDRASLLKMIYAQESDDGIAFSQNAQLEEMLKNDRKLKKLISDLQKEQLVQYINSKLVLTNMGKYLARIL